MRKILFIAATLLPLYIFSSCKPDDPVTPEDIGGKGGTTTIKATPVHHTQLIDSAVIYVKYNTSDRPGNGLYDDSAKVVMENGKPVATFSGLKKGKYYFAGRGYDPSIAENVAGGIPYTISENDVILSITVPVTEDHK